MSNNMIKLLQEYASDHPVDVTIFNVNYEKGSVAIFAMVNHLSAHAITIVTGSKKEIDSFLNERSQILNTAFYIVSRKVPVAPCDHRIIAFDVDLGMSHEVETISLWDESSELDLLDQSVEDTHKLFEVVNVLQRNYNRTYSHYMTDIRKFLVAS